MVDFPWNFRGFYRQHYQILSISSPSNIQHFSGPRLFVLGGQRRSISILGEESTYKSRYPKGYGLGLSTVLHPKDDAVIPQTLRRLSPISAFADQDPESEGLRLNRLNRQVLRPSTLIRPMNPHRHHLEKGGNVHKNRRSNTPKKIEKLNL